MSKGRRHITAPPQQRVQQPQVDPFAGKSYRVRRIYVKLDVDIYDDSGRYKETVLTDPPVMIAESEFPDGFEKLVCSKADLPRGFSGTKKPNKPVAVENEKAAG